nr:MAG TPA_asm: hypothetical protein [Caudoviricetes sp.]
MLYLHISENFRTFAYKKSLFCGVLGYQTCIYSYFYVKI